MNLVCSFFVYQDHQWVLVVTVVAARVGLLLDPALGEAESVSNLELVNVIPQKNRIFKQTVFCSVFRQLQD